jgi:hypothetical protein
LEAFGAFYTPFWAAYDFFFIFFVQNGKLIERLGLLAIQQ